MPIKPKWGPNCADDAGVRASAGTGASSAQLAPHCGSLSVELKRRRQQKHQQGWGGLGLHNGWVGGGAAARPALAARP